MRLVTLCLLSFFISSAVYAVCPAKQTRCIPPSVVKTDAFGCQICVVSPPEPGLKLKSIKPNPL